MTGSGRSQTSTLWQRVRACRPSPAMVVALVALFVAMGGTTYAVTSLPKRSVGSAQLKKGAVHKENIATGAVTASKLAKGLVGNGPRWTAGPTVPIIVNQDIPSDGVAYASKAGWADNAGKADRASLAEKATDRDDRDQRDERWHRDERRLGRERRHARRPGFERLRNPEHGRRPAALRPSPTARRR